MLLRAKLNRTLCWTCELCTPCDYCSFARTLWKWHAVEHFGIWCNFGKEILHGNYGVEYWIIHLFSTNKLSFLVRERRRDKSSSALFNEWNNKKREEDLTWHDLHLTFSSRPIIIIRVVNKELHFPEWNVLVHFSFVSLSFSFAIFGWHCQDHMDLSYDNDRCANIHWTFKLSGWIGNYFRFHCITNW